LKKASKNKNLVTYFRETPRTIPRDLKHSFKATEIHFFPAPAGSGIIAGEVINSIFKYLGIQDVSAKIIGSRNKTNVVKCVFQALDKL
jgi:small subunit ribosomal protein S5